MMINKILQAAWRPGMWVVLIAFLAPSLGRPQSQDDQIVLRSDLVLVPVTVRDKKGRPVTDLQQEDFTLLVDGKPQPIVFFSSEKEANQIARPLALTLLLDTSRSISAVLHQQRSAVTSFLNQLGGKTLVSLIRFSQTQEVLLGFTAEKTEALTAFFKQGRIGGDTAIFNAISFAVENLDALPDGDLRKVVVVISDGLDTASTTNYRQCVQVAEEHGVAIYSILIPIYAPYGDRLVVRRPTKGFIEMAEESGGKFFQAGTMEQALNPSAKLDLGPVFAAIIEDLGSQYHLGFYPPENEQSGFHRLEVRVGRKNAKAELRRRGYVARSSQ